MAFAVLILVFLVFCDRDLSAMTETEASSDSATGMTLDAVRDALIRQEDTIIFHLIERAKFPVNSPTYDESRASILGFCGSLVQFIVKETEAAQAKVNLIFFFPNKNECFDFDSEFLYAFSSGICCLFISQI